MNTHTTKQGDNYRKLAEIYYHNGDLWPNIQHANPDIDMNNIPIGAVIKIPESPDQNKLSNQSSTIS
ncbi:LysM peptidoglycan-binding domain-containing protein [Nostoc sp.]|uniref:LysM peptidoglycan-binding domain-containing protein n=1 Tax=Nostoc sp. TaxID=1180 RepID=UPI002FFD4390